MAHCIGIIYSDTMKKVLGGISFKDTIAFYKDRVMYWYAMKDALDKAAQKAFSIVKKDPEYLHKLRKKFIESVPLLVEFSLKFYKADLSKKSNKELWESYLKYINLYDEIYTYGEPITLGLNESLGSYLQKYLTTKTANKKELTEYYNLLVSPQEMSFIKREDRDLLKIAMIIKKNKELLNLFVTQDIPKIKTQLKKEKKEYGVNCTVNNFINKHTNEYEWVPFDYGVSTWSKDYFLNTLKAMLKDGNIEERLRKTKEYFKNLVNNQKIIAKKLDIDINHQKLFVALRDCAFLMDYKKEEFTKSHLYIMPLMGEIGKRLGLTTIEARYLLPDETKKYLLSSKKPNREKIQSRTKRCLVYWKGRTAKIYESEEAQKKFDSLMKEEIEAGADAIKIDGIIASPGRAVGRVKVVLNPRDIYKVHKNDILVAVMTSPDYVIGMKKAAAIITDEGGITCHAAIVSRELGIPCVVGTKIATKYLKNNEVIEVNANHGSVRILKKS